MATERNDGSIKDARKYVFDAAYTRLALYASTGAPFWLQTVYVLDEEDGGTIAGPVHCEWYAACNRPVDARQLQRFMVFSIANSPRAGLPVVDEAARKNPALAVALTGIQRHWKSYLDDSTWIYRRRRQRQQQTRKTSWYKQQSYGEEEEQEERDEQQQQQDGEEEEEQEIDQNDRPPPPVRVDYACPVAGGAWFIYRMRFINHFAMYYFWRRFQRELAIDGQPCRVLVLKTVRRACDPRRLSIPPVSLQRRAVLASIDEQEKQFADLMAGMLPQWHGAVVPVLEKRPDESVAAAAAASTASIKTSGLLLSGCPSLHAYTTAMVHVYKQQEQTHSHLTVLYDVNTKHLFTDETTQRGKKRSCPEPGANNAVQPPPISERTAFVYLLDAKPVNRGIYIPLEECSLSVVYGAKRLKRI